MQRGLPLFLRGVLYGSAGLLLVTAALPSRAADPAPGAAAPAKFPEPSLYPVSWELHFEHKTPKRIVVDLPGEGHPKAYWYITYAVTNEGTEPVTFLPQFDLVDNDGKIIRSDRAVPHEVFDTIKKRDGIRLLESAAKIEGAVQPGEDNARDGVAIWPEPLGRMGTFSIFAGGLSGEYVTMKHAGDGWTAVTPEKAPEELKGVDEKDRMTLRKTLQLTFQVPGDEIRPGDDPVIKRGEKWVMR